MDTPTLLLLAQNAVDVGNMKAACEFYEVALQQSPNNDEVLEAYAEIMIHYVQDPVRAQRMLRHAISVNPHEGYVKYLNLAQLCEPEESIQLYRTAYDIAERMLGRCKKKQKKAVRDAMSTMCCAVAEIYLTDLCFAENAEQNCEFAVNRALELNSESVEAHQLQASLRLSQSRPEEALAALRQAVDLTRRLGEEYQPTYESKLELSRLLMQVQPAEAFAFLLEVLQLNDMNPYVWFLLGESARLRGRFPDAARLLRRARVLLLLPYSQTPPSAPQQPAPSLSEEDATALREIDEAIAVLVQEMGGPEAAAQIPDLDCPNPLELLAEEEEEEGAGATEAPGDVVLDEPVWEPMEDEDDS